MSVAARTPRTPGGVEHHALTLGELEGGVFTWWAACPCGWLGPIVATECQADWDRLAHLEEVLSAQVNGAVGKYDDADVVLFGPDREPVRMEDGLTEDELWAVEDIFGFNFSPDHRELLRAALPTAAGWPNWRHGPERMLRAWLAQPIVELTALVRGGRWWLPSWGSRPLDDREAVMVAHLMLAGAPRLVPLHDSCYVPAVQRPEAPVFNILPGKATVVGADVREYLRSQTHGLGGPRALLYRGVQVWSEVVQYDAASQATAARVRGSRGPGQP